MANGSLPAYLASAKPNPASNRGPWYMNTAPSYAGIFLWIAFYEALGTVLPVGGIGAALIGLVLAAAISYLLFYKVFGLLGMKTGYPLYVVGSSTFGTKGGIIFPGLFMGLLQIGWYSVATYFATDLVLQAFKVEGVKTLFGPGEQGFSLIFVVIAVAWGYSFATLGALGIKYVAKMSQFFPIIPLAILIIAAIGGASGVCEYKPTGPEVSTLAGICLMVQLVVGFFASAGAAGVDFGINSRNSKDVSMGGITGIGLAIIVAGGLGVLAVAGAHGIDPELESFDFSASLLVVSPKLAPAMALLFAIGSVAPACFCSFIMGNSLSTMIPSLPRVAVTLAGATVGIALAAMGIAGNLGAFFGLIGASFGPICGAMVADYLLSGRKWAGPREGVSIAGYLAWIVGFAVGICNNAMVTSLLGKEILPGWHPTAVYSFVVGFVVYAILAKIGLQGKTVPMPGASGQPAA